MEVLPGLIETSNFMFRPLAREQVLEDVSLRWIGVAVL
jgi:hypothetical protein